MLSMASCQKLSLLAAAATWLPARERFSVQWCDGGGKEWHFKYLGLQIVCLAGLRYAISFLQVYFAASGHWQVSRSETVTYF
jgi:hypothetical protein